MRDVADDEDIAKEHKCIESDCAVPANSMSQRIRQASQPSQIYRRYIGSPEGEVDSNIRSLYAEDS